MKDTDLMIKCIDDADKIQQKRGGIRFSDEVLPITIALFNSRLHRDTIRHDNLRIKMLTKREIIKICRKNRLDKEESRSLILFYYVNLFDEIPIDQLFKIGICAITVNIVWQYISQ